MTKAKPTQDFRFPRKCSCSHPTPAACTLSLFGDYRTKLKPKHQNAAFKTLVFCPQPSLPALLPRILSADTRDFCQRRLPSVPQTCPRFLVSVLLILLFLLHEFKCSKGLVPSGHCTLEQQTPEWGISILVGREDFSYSMSPV